MKAIETSGVVRDDGTVTLTLGDVRPGPHRLIVVVADEDESVKQLPLSIPTLSIPSWPAEFELTREAMYDDDGR